MPKRATEPVTPRDLRSRAAFRLAGDGRGAHHRASEALAVLYALASSPSTAADALALLHELQVHQVELDLQAEELRESRGELESALRRQIQLYECAPVGCFTVDPDGALRELNLTGAALLGCERDMAMGQSLFAFLAPDSARELRSLLTVGEGDVGEPRALQLMRREGGLRTVHATACVDPAGSSVLVAMMDVAADGTCRRR